MADSFLGAEEDAHKTGGTMSILGRCLHKKSTLQGAGIRSHRLNHKVFIIIFKLFNCYEYD